MNLFRLAGDITHLVSVVVLLLKIHTIKTYAENDISKFMQHTKNCRQCGIGSLELTIHRGDFNQTPSAHPKCQRTSSKPSSSHSALAAVLVIHECL